MALPGFFIECCAPCKTYHLTDSRESYSMVDVKE